MALHPLRPLWTRHTPPACHLHAACTPGIPRLWTRRAPHLPACRLHTALRRLWTQHRPTCACMPLHRMPTMPPWTLHARSWTHLLAARKPTADCTPLHALCQLWTRLATSACRIKWSIACRCTPWTRRARCMPTCCMNAPAAGCMPTAWRCTPFSGCRHGPPHLHAIARKRLQRAGGKFIKASTSKSASRLPLPRSAPLSVPPVPPKTWLANTGWCRSESFLALELKPKWAFQGRLSLMQADMALT